MGAAWRSVKPEARASCQTRAAALADLVSHVADRRLGDLPMDQRLHLQHLLEAAHRALSADEEFHREDAEDLARRVVKLGEWMLEQDLFAEPLPAHPVQPIVFDRGGVARFRLNKAVRYLLDFTTRTTGLNLQVLHEMPGFPAEDLEQLYQLIGTSVSTYGDVFPDSSHLPRADAEVERLRTLRPQSDIRPAR
jgi:hypothetical protein